MAKYNETLANRITTLIAEQLCSISDICKATGISRNTFYKWKRENPGFNEEIEEAMEYRNEELLSMAYSSIRQRLERHTIVEEKDTYTPDENDPEKLKFKSKVIRKKEHLSDLRTIKMILDRADKQKEKKSVTANLQKGEPLKANQKERPDNDQKTEIEPKPEKSGKTERNIFNEKKTFAKNIKSSIKILNGNRTRNHGEKRKNRLRQTA